MFHDLNRLYCIHYTLYTLAYCIHFWNIPLILFIDISCVLSKNIKDVTKKKKKIHYFTHICHMIWIAYIIFNIKNNNEKR